MLLSLTCQDFEAPPAKEELEQEVTTSFLHHPSPSHPNHHRLQNFQSRPWVISTSLFAVISLTLALALAFEKHDPSGRYSYENGFATDLSTTSPPESNSPPPFHLYHRCLVIDVSGS